MKKILVLLVCLFSVALVSGQVSFFSESMGTPAVTTLVNSYSGWQNSPPVLFSSTGTQSDVRTSSPSAGYTGATGNGNIFMGTAGTNARDFVITGINTAAYTAIELSFGVLTNTANTMVTVEYSTDGTSYLALTVSNIIAANTWTLKTATGTIPSGSNISLRFSKNAAVQFRIDDVMLNGIPAGTPDIVLSSPNPSVSAATVAQGSLHHPIYRFDLAVSNAPATLTGLSIQTAGTYAATDLNNLKCWYSQDALFDAGTDILLSVKTTGLGAGVHVFPAFLPQTISSGSIGYFFITADISCVAVVSHNLFTDPVTLANLIFSSGNSSGSAFAGGLQTVGSAIPLNVTGETAVGGNSMAIVDWINPTTCFDEIMLVAAAGLPNTGTPAGDGSAYTASLVFGSGTALGNGFVVYKGVAGPQTVTGLSNGSTYNFKLFTRLGSSWSTGTEISAIPVAISAATDHFRSAVPSGNWDQPASWESSPNGLTNWIPATLSPHSGAGIITVMSGDTIHIVNSVTIDQVVVEPGANLVLNAGIVLADGTGAADLEVSGTLINSAGTHSYTGTVVFNAGSIYQHNRNAGTVPSATWHSSSNCVFTGITATAPGGLSQLFGNVQWDCAGQTASVNLAGALTQVAGNLVISHCSATAGRVLRLTGTATNPVISVGGDFVINSSNARFEYGNGSATGAQLQIGGSFLMSAGTFNANVNGSLQVVFTGANKDFNQSGDNFNGTQVNWLLQPGASLNLLSNIPVAAGRILTVMGTLNAAQLQVTGGGAVTVEGTLITGHSNGIGSNGTLANTGTVTIGTASTIQFHSANPQQLTARTDYANMMISGGGSKTLNGPVTMSGSLLLNAGLVLLGPYDFIHTNPSPVAAVSAYNNTSYLVTNGTGAFSRTVSDAGTYVFPVGTINHLQEASVGFANALAIPNTISTLFITGNGGVNGLPLNETGHLINRTSAFGYWQLSAGTAFTEMYTATFIAKAFGDIIDYSRLHLLKRTDASSPWVLDGIHVPTTGANFLATLQRTGMSGFSQFGVGGENNVSLPVVFSGFIGFREQRINQLQWTTESELQNRGFEVQRSANGRDFKSIGFVESIAPDGNSPSKLQYRFKDLDPGPQTQYYRLRQMDTGGREKYSHIIAIQVNRPAGLSIEKIYPLPVRDQASFLLYSARREIGKLAIMDITGRILIQRTVLLEPGTNTLFISMANILPGYLRIQLTGSDGNSCQAGLLKQ